MTARQYQNRLAQFPQILADECRKTIRATGISALSRSKQLLTEQIYAIPEDRTKSGKKKWRRTGALRRSERIEERGPYTVAVVNSLVYAEPRHEAGKPGRRNINPLRESHWRDDLAADFAPVMADLADLAVRKAMERLTR